MAETPVAPNNKEVDFKAKPVSEPSTVTSAAPVKSLSPRGRKKAKRAIKRGMISEKAAKKHFGDGY